MSVEPFGGVKCKCGNFGCLEVYASATAVVRLTREGLAQHPSSRLHSISTDQLTSADVHRAAVEGDPLALDVFHSVGVHLGIAMASIVDIFNPEMIVVGGGVSAACDLFAPFFSGNDDRGHRMVRGMEKPRPNLSCVLLCGMDCAGRARSRQEGREPKSVMNFALPEQAVALELIVVFSHPRRSEALQELCGHGPRRAAAHAHRLCLHQSQRGAVE